MQQPNFELVYHRLHDYVGESYNTQSDQTGGRETRVYLSWDGCQSVADLIRQHEADWLKSTNPGSSNHRIEVIATRTGGEGGVMHPIEKITICPLKAG